MKLVIIIFSRHLVLAVVVRLQVLHVEPVVRRTDSTEVKRVTDLEEDLFVKSTINTIKNKSV